MVTAVSRKSNFALTIVIGGIGMRHRSDRNGLLREGLLKRDDRPIVLDHPPRDQVPPRPLFHFKAEIRRSHKRRRNRMSEEFVLRLRDEEMDRLRFDESVDLTVEQAMCSCEHMPGTNQRAGAQSPSQARNDIEAADRRPWPAIRHHRHTMILRAQHARAVVPRWRL